MTEHPSIRFVIFAVPRTGSNLLCGLLNAHPQVLCHHGLFNPGGIHCARDSNDHAFRKGGVAGRDRNPSAFLDAVWAGHGGARAIGFKMNRDENEGAMALLSHDPGIRKILLRRRNRVRTYVSEEIARLTGVWESYDSPADAKMPKVRIEPDDLIRHGMQNSRYYARIERILRGTDQRWLDTCYEALADPGEIARILSFLGIGTGAPLPAASHKRGPAKLGTVVTNFDELETALRGTALLDDLYRPDLPELRHHEFTP